MTAETIHDAATNPQRTSGHERTIELLTTLHDTYAGIAAERMYRDEPSYLWELLAEQVEFRIAALDPENHTTWRQGALRREISRCQQRDSGGLAPRSARQQGPSTQ